MLDKTYEDYIKEEEYKQIADVLLSSDVYRNNNAKAIQCFYKRYYGITMDEAINRLDVPSLFTIERKIRKLKQVNHKLQGKNQSQDDFKEIGLEVPYMVKLI